MNINDMNQPLLQWRLLPLWLGLALILMPFLSIWRVGVLSSFYLEAGSLMAALMLVLMSAVMFGMRSVFSGSLKTFFPPAALYFLILALFWAVQARVMKLPYVGQSDMAAWSFAVYALLAWACRVWVVKVGQERVVSVLAWLLVAAACAQGVVAWLQYTGDAAKFSGYLMYRKGIVEGQLGQYNHLGHFMMWGVLAAGYLWGVRRMAWWLAAPVLLYLTMTTGIIVSRTLMAYVLAMAVLLPTWRVLAGKSANRAVCCLGVATILVIVFQFALEPMMQLFNDHAQINSSLERLSHQNETGMGRIHELKKAWQLFLSAPIWGHGWGSYPAYSFLIDEHIYRTGFRLYDPNVLFTHSHNSYLNLLAEMGLVGTFLVLGGLIWLVSGSLKMRNAPNLLLLALMAVSLTHSMLEYPLWYIYFLTAFALFPILITAEETALHDSGSLKPSAALNWTMWGMGAAALAIMIGIIRLAFAYNDLVIATKKNADTKERTEQIMHLLLVSRTEPMLAHYADLTLINFTHTNQKNLPDWAHLAQKSITFRPYAHAYKHGLILYKQGKTDEAKRWMHLVYRYYPQQMKLYGNEIMMNPDYTGLREQYTAECQAYRIADKSAPPCAESLPPKTEFE